MGAHFLTPEAEIATSGIDASGLQGRHVLVTGASGAVGINVVAALRALAECGADFALSAVVQSDPPAPLAAVFGHRFCRVVRADLSDAAARARLPAADVVIHCAGYGQPSRFLDSPIKTIRVNVDATCDLLDRMRPGGRLLFVSSTEVYSGLAPGLRYHEAQLGRTAPQHPRSCYIEGKRCGEAACHAAFQGGIAAIAVRLAQTYGPGAKPGDRRALYSFIEQGLSFKKISLLDQGRAIRTYCYTADAVRMMLRVLFSGKQPVYNISGNTPITMLEVATKVAVLLESQMLLPDEDRSSAGATPSMMINMERYVREFGPPTYVDFDTGLRRTIEWHALMR